MISDILQFASAFFFGIAACIWGLCAISNRQTSARDPASALLGMLLTLIPLAVAIGLFLLAQQPIAYAAAG